MKYFLILLFFFSTSLKGQNFLNFDKRFVECEDKWVAFQKGKDSTYAYGFIYIDAQAGLTLNYEGNFTVSENGSFIPKKLDKSNVKIRLQANNVLVSYVPENKYSELNIPAIPEWLKNYKVDSNSIERLYKWGYMYNGWGECAKALTFLEQAQKIKPKYKGLEVEIAFSFNCLSKYDKAISVLKSALETNSTDAYINKELIYAQIKSGQLDKASESCKIAIANCTDQTYNGENCYNLLHSYYLIKDRLNFQLWLNPTKKWVGTNENLIRSIKTMEDEISK